VFISYTRITTLDDKATFEDANIYADFDY